MEKQLLDNFAYDRETGAFIRVKSIHLHPAGKRVDRIDCRGYRVVIHNRRSIRAHRLAWLFEYGEWPNGDIDHANGDRQDNRIVNLRLASKSQNSANAKGRGAYAKGVAFNRSCNKFQAQIKWQGDTHYLGVFDTEAEAAAAYERASVDLHGEFAFCNRERVAPREAA